MVRYRAALRSDNSFRNKFTHFAKDRQDKQAISENLLDRGFNPAAMTIAIPIVTPAALHTSYFLLHTSIYQNSKNSQIADPHQKCE